VTGTGSVSQSLLSANHLAALVPVAVHLSVAFDLHGLDLTGLSVGPLHDPGADLVSNLYAVVAVTSLSQPESHLLTLASPDQEVIEFVLILGLLLLLDLNDLASHPLVVLLSQGWYR
jgi:hypothetical protein